MFKLILRWERLMMAGVAGRLAFRSAVHRIVFTRETLFEPRSVCCRNIAFLCRLFAHFKAVVEGGANNQSLDDLI